MADNISYIPLEKLEKKAFFVTIQIGYVSFLTPFWKEKFQL